MSTIVKEIGNHKYTFYCEWVDCRDGFSHVCELYKDGYKLNSNRVHYLNRTWESYEFQSVMRGCVQNEIERILNKAIADYKTANGITRLVKDRKEKVIEAVHNSKEYGELKILLDMVDNARYGTEEERERLESLDKMVKLTEALSEIGFFGKRVS